MRITGNKVFLLAVLLLPVLALILVKLWWSSSGGYSAYKAVLLANKMSYFSKVKNLNADFVILTDVFYVRAKTATGKEVPPAPAGFELVKLGGEIHGPEDAIILNRRQVISIQSLKEDSQIIRAIRGYYLARE